MKALMFGFSLLTLLPGVLAAQSRLRIAPPAVRFAVGPLSIRASMEAGGLAVRAAPRRTRSSTITGGRGSGRGTASAVAILATGDRYVGTPYAYGGETPSAGFDCSGFVQYVFARHGIKLPRTSREQAGAGWKLPDAVASLRPGDLMLFSSTGSRIDHVAIYAGEGRILHSSRGGGGVLYDELSSSRGQWFVDHHVSSRRVIG
jgi:cell wall-associated NlpC family hydrolase